MSPRKKADSLIPDGATPSPKMQREPAPTVDLTSTSRQGSASAATQDAEKPKFSPWNAARRFYAVVPVYESLSPEARGAIITDGYPVVTVEHLPQHRGFIDFLVDWSIEAWTRSQG